MIGGKDYAMIRCMLLALFSAILVSSSFAVTLVKDGKALCAIYVEPAVMEEKGAHPRLRESVKDLALYLGKMSGAQVEIVTAEPAKGDARIPILIGVYAQRAFGAPKQHSPWNQCWRMTVTEKGIGLQGESDEAASYAIYEVLDRLGCRWYLPGEMGESIPSMRTITLVNADLSAIPPILGRNIGGVDADYQRRNRCGGLQVQINNLGTSMKMYLSKEQLEAHPAWNAEVNGKRDVTGVFCWSNPEVQAAVADSIIARLDANYTNSVTLSQPYSSPFCECAKCKALDAGDWCQLMNEPSMTDRYIWFCNRVAERVTKKYPNELFGVLLNMNYIDPPVREKPLPSLVPAIVAVNSCRGHSMSEATCPSRQELRAIVAGWGKLSKHLIGYEFAYNLAEVQAPYPLLRWTQDIPYLFANNVKFWMPQGWVQNEMRNQESTLPGVYLGMRLAWNPKAKPAQVLNEFYAGCYGPAARPMQRYWQSMDDAWQKTPEHAGSHYGFFRRFLPDTMAAARAALDEALQAAANTGAYPRVKLADDGFRSFSLYMKMRTDLNFGQFADLETDGARWLAQYRDFTAQYNKGNAAFAPLASDFFQWFCVPLYRDAARIAKDGTPISLPLTTWRYQLDREKKGMTAGWSAVAFDDSAWKQTDTAMESWGDLDLFSYYGSMWYRTKINTGDIPVGKKSYLWVSGVDDTCQVFINGQHIPYINAKGETVAEITDFGKPLTFDITAAVKPWETNQITLRCTRSTLNEVGTGGLLGPVVIYREK